MMENIALGVQNLFNIELIIFLNLGVLVGIVFGAIPGLTGVLGIIMMLPFSYVMEPATAIIFLTSIYIGSEFGGSISAILIGTPGTNEAACTLLDGYPLAQQGHARKALLVSLICSTIGGVISALVLLLFAPPIAKFTINFGPPEYFALSIFGLSIIAAISGDSIIKGLISGCLGMLIAIVGMDGISGTFRFTFGNMNMMRGLSLLAVLTGVFAIPNILGKVQDILQPSSIQNPYQQILVNKKEKVSLKELQMLSPTIIKSSIIGVIIGAIPGAGTAIAAFISYNEAKRTSKVPELFGNGALEGIAASESANNAVTSASLIPLLTLGIPGSPAAAVLIGAFMLHGMIPGPALFKEQGVIVYTIMVGLLLANFFMYFQGRFLSKPFAIVTKVPNIILIPVLALICTLGAYAVNNSIFEIGVFLTAGLVAYFLGKLGFPQVPIVLGFVLGPIAEINLRRSMAMSDSRWDIFLKRPISLIFIILTILAFSVGKNLHKKTKKIEADQNCTNEGLD